MTPFTFKMRGQQESDQHLSAGPGGQGHPTGLGLGQVGATTMAAGPRRCCQSRGWESRAEQVLWRGGDPWSCCLQPACPHGLSKRTWDLPCALTQLSMARLHP